MKINDFEKLEKVSVQMEGAKDVTMTILVGKEDGSKNMIMRHFSVMPGGHTPLHSHDYEHVVMVLKGRGVAVDKDGSEHEISIGKSLFVAPNEKHQFKNPHEEPFEFICVIPER